ncbi:hypothetical protein Cantr_10473 [Candida viswanathii]|uniref:Uncharacterized protein n=1 Tax=Candida viswanathii TaxID=5486 RepID=A0A367YEB3_9ASCO|nr:hypothetical protein Cantr_10473 [Candida viswanathii]
MTSTTLASNNLNERGDEEEELKIKVEVRDSVEQLTYLDLLNHGVIYKVSDDQALIYQDDKWIHIHTSHASISTPTSPSLSFSSTFSHNSKSLSPSGSHSHRHRNSNTNRDLDSPRRAQQSIPISNCLNQVHGDGGAIEVERATIYTMINTWDLLITLNVIFYYEKFTHAWELRKSLTLRNIYYCNVPPGYVGQIWLEFMSESFDGVRYRVVEVPTKLLSLTKGKGNGKGKVKKILRRKLKFGKWMDLGKVVLLNGKHAPVIKCRTSHDVNDGKLDCRGDALLKNSKNFQLL